jgi:hypothetical protein
LDTLVVTDICVRRDSYDDSSCFTAFTSTGWVAERGVVRGKTDYQQYHGKPAQDGWLNAALFRL